MEIFTEELFNLTLMSDTGSNLFSNIRIESLHSDQTFTATMRALLHERLPPEVSVKVSLINLNCVSSIESIIEGITAQELGSYYYIFIVVPCNRRAWPQLLEVVSNNIGAGKKYFNEYEEQKDLRLFYKKMFDGLFYVDGRDAMIFLDYVDTQRLHALQMMIPRYIPSIFVSNPLSDEERALLKSLGNKSSCNYKRLIEQFASKLNMRDEIIKAKLKDFESEYVRSEEQKVMESLERNKDEYNKCLNRLHETDKLIQNNLLILSGLQCQINRSGNTPELMNYFLCNKQLSIIKVDGSEVEFVVRGYADVYDESAFNEYAKNYNSFLYYSINSKILEEDMEILYRAIFNDSLYRLRICAAFRLSLRDSVRPLQHYNYPSECKDYLPNPHTDLFGCIGGYASKIFEFLHNKDYIGAIEQIVISARNLNFHDSIVMGKFARKLSYARIKCIEDNEGNCITPGMAISKLKGDI